MIEIKAPQKAARGSGISCSYAITGAESETLRTGGEAVAELSCAIIHRGYGGQLPAENPVFAGLVLKNLHAESKRFGKSPSGNFDFTLPSGLPATYNGKLFNVKWIIKVKIDIPMALDKNASQELVVE